jgi:FkbM family methyltransferase
MQLNLADPHERGVFFLGRGEEKEVDLVLKAGLRPGDTFIDVGANIGTLTLLASRLVEPHGRVIAFEPNPVIASRVLRSLQDNRIKNATLHQVALSDSSGEMTLRVVGGMAVLGTLAPLSPGDACETGQQFTIPVVRGDDLDLGPPERPVMVKIDVEGWECAVVRGIACFLRASRAAVVTEVEDAWLRRAGTSPVELFDLLTSLGYRAFRIEMRRRNLRYGCWLQRLDGPAALTDTSARQRAFRNVLWLASGSEHERRLANVGVR